MTQMLLFLLLLLFCETVLRSYCKSANMNSHCVCFYYRTVHKGGPEILRLDPSKVKTKHS